MNLETCPICKKPISGTPEKCPQCGADLECYDVLEVAEEREKKKIRFLKKTGILFLGLILVNTILLFFLIFNFKAQKKTYNRISKTLIELTETKEEKSQKADSEINNSPEKIIPKNPETYSLKNYDAALKFCYRGKFEEAITEFENLLQTNYPPIYKKNILYWLGLSYYGLNEYPKAKEYFKLALENTGFKNKNADALFMLGKISYYEKRFASSKKYFSECLRKYPENSNIDKIRKYLVRM